jgi:hypothetical protein
MDGSRLVPSSALATGSGAPAWLSGSGAKMRIDLVVRTVAAKTRAVAAGEAP